MGNSSSCFSDLVTLIAQLTQKYSSAFILAFGKLEHQKLKLFIYFILSNG